MHNQTLPVLISAEICDSWLGATVLLLDPTSGQEICPSSTHVCATVRETERDAEALQAMQSAQPENNSDNKTEIE